MSSDPEQNEPLLPSGGPASDYYGANGTHDSSIDPKALRSVDNDVVPETATIGRNLSWSSAYIIVISRVIGSGIFAMPGTIFKSVGSIGLSLLLWVIGAFIAWCGLAVALEYGCMLPRSGGEKVYLEYTYRRPRFLASTLVAAQAVLLGFTASNCIIFGKYVLFAFDLEPTDAAQKVLAVGLLTVITVVHGCFLKTGIFVQNVLGWAKVVLIVFMFLTGLFVVTFRVGSDASSTVSTTTTTGPNTPDWDRLWEGSDWNWGILCTATFKVSYAYAGLNNMNYVLNEVKDPVRTLKSVTPTALLSACLMYLLMNVAYFAVVPAKEIRQSGELIAALFCERVFGSGFGRTILPLAIAVSAAGNVMVVTFALVSWCCNFEGGLHTLISICSGPCESRNRPPGLPPLLTPPLFFPPLRRTFGWVDRPLHPFIPCHRPPPLSGRLRLHRRRRTLPGPVLRPGRLDRVIVAAGQETRSESPV